MTHHKDGEKRKYQRLNPDCEVSFAVGPEADKKKRIYFNVQAKNISADGLAFEYRKELPLGTFLHLKLNFLSRDTIVKVRGEVQRCTTIRQAHEPADRFVIGVKFSGSTKHLGSIFMHCMRPTANLLHR